MIISESELRRVLRCIREYDQIEECVEIERLKRENEKLSVDSVVLDEIISVVYGWNRDARGYPDMAMKKIAKIIEERGDIYENNLQKPSVLRNNQASVR